ncbi:hypothetical protein NTGHW29_150062 [Candidatus Nitrotoga sp. HW29]|uniref:DUF3325 family protein n=1 Tax=Candidatus Nitrotoga sp. HW29 TaxID=2886963 RepID=UPI001EF22A0E|nr:DUF3325 family protein [Candidatus Nitrotoga sp. HW29]CAH1903818.1 hypothetical protein NTGHW29_150062 [Candidatus Nitrotoga sp. HW29]
MHAACLDIGLRWSVALAVDRHNRQVWYRSVSNRLHVLLRLAGMVGIGLSLTVSVAHLGGSDGIVLG